ncbi:hypothetical protein CBM2634_B170416 [Cupriavidus taiwanensis]|uniref:Uncharacterized protein n=1 Tax=Cupriavidus taiwanensis TaxID=164546 RepID=A0A375J884_9BURK|nr:hypothetical protein CBM2634_B170416 [Cupriavidus taiwanensis]
MAARCGCGTRAGPRCCIPMPRPSTRRCRARRRWWRPRWSPWRRGSTCRAARAMCTATHGRRNRWPTGTSGTACCRAEPGTRDFLPNPNAGQALIANAAARVSVRLDAGFGRSTRSVYFQINEAF